MKASTYLKYAVPFLALGLAALPAAAADTVRVYITNSAGDAIDVIDPATNTVVQKIENFPGAHALDFSPDGSRVYVTNEETNTLELRHRPPGHLIIK